METRNIARKYKIEDELISQIFSRSNLPFQRKIGDHYAIVTRYFDSKAASDAATISSLTNKVIYYKLTYFDLLAFWCQLHDHNFKGPTSRIGHDFEQMEFKVLWEVNSMAIPSNFKSGYRNFRSGNKVDGRPQGRT